ncbi:MAG TPA: choice-of-anchor Q domain-containing protein, partial [Tepidisphaeraceae bacterium]|nr:choice-of-anchor Q domain-containing protein [Tepidisphaeraceae bacterium]
SDVTVEGFTITLGNANGSSTNADGGGLYAVSSNATFINCIFFANTASSIGGGAFDNGGNRNFVNCLFVSNSAATGGAVYGTGAQEVFTNCTFTANSASSSGRAIAESSATGVIINCILWADTGNASGEIFKSGRSGAITVSYSDIQNGYSGTNNLNVNPLFLQAPSSGNIGNLRLSTSSPVIDVGANGAVPGNITTDLDGNPRFVDYPLVNDPGAIVDLGAFETQRTTVLAAALVTPAGNQLTFQFSRNVSSSLTTNSLNVSTLAGNGGAVSVLNVGYDSNSNTATFTLASALSAGIYQADINASVGNMASDYLFDFLYMPNGSSLALPGQQTYTVQQFYMDSSATLDIGNDAVVIEYAGVSPAASIWSLISSGYNHGQWNGVGIESSDITMGTGVGYYDSGSSVKIRRTWDGDTNLDGEVNADDLSLVAFGQVMGQTQWQSGNFNYDAHVNSDDWLLLSLGAAVSNGQIINTGAVTTGALPASHATALTPAIATASTGSAFSSLLISADPTTDVRM